MMLAPLPAHAEAAHQTFDCRATLVCDGAGACEPADEHVPTFTLSQYEDFPEHSITQGPIEADAIVPADGPLIFWTEADGTLHSLTTTGRTSPTTASMVWQVVRPGPSSAVVRFMFCEVTP